MKRLVGTDTGDGPCQGGDALSACVDSSELQRLTGELGSRLPEHTFKAVMRRAAGRDSDESRVALLADLLGEWERGEMVPAKAVA